MSEPLGFFGQKDLQEKYERLVAVHEALKERIVDLSLAWKKKSPAVAEQIAELLTGA